VADLDLIEDCPQRFFGSHRAVLLEKSRLRRFFRNVGCVFGGKKRGFCPGRAAACPGA